MNFKHTSWLRPSFAGHVPLQDGMYLIDAYKLHDPGTPGNETLENQAWLGRQPAGVAIQDATKINFYKCTFQHLATTGLDFITGVNHCEIEGCVFNDIGGSGIKAGFYGDLSIEAHIPYDPFDFREVCDVQADTFRSDGIGWQDSVVPLPVNQRFYPEGISKGH